MNRVIESIKKFLWIVAIVLLILPSNVEAKVKHNHDEFTGKKTISTKKMTIKRFWTSSDILKLKAVKCYEQCDNNQDSQIQLLFSLNGTNARLLYANELNFLVDGKRILLGKGEYQGEEEYTKQAALWNRGHNTSNFGQARDITLYEAISYLATKEELTKIINGLSVKGRIAAMEFSLNKGVRATLKEFINEVNKEAAKP